MRLSIPCGIGNCKGKMKIDDIFNNSYPKTFRCPKCGGYAIMEASGLIKRYDCDGNLVSYNNKEEN